MSEGKLKVATEFFEFIVIIFVICFFVYMNIVDGQYALCMILSVQRKKDAATSFNREDK